MILIISIVHVQVLIPGQGDAEFNSLKRDQKPRLLYRQLGDPEKLETISQTSSVNPVKALSCEILSIYCVEKNKTSTIINISIMLFYPTIGSKYFAKTQTYVALFGPHELSLIFAGGMCLEQTSL